MSTANRLIIWLNEQVHETATDISLTVWLPGSVVTGRLTSGLFFQQWLVEATNRAKLGGGFKLPTLRVPEPSDEGRAAVAKQYQELAGEEQSAEQITDDDLNAEPNRDVRFGLFFRNARALQHGNWTEHPYVVVDSREIVAWAVGEMREPKG